MRTKCKNFDKTDLFFQFWGLRGEGDKKRGIHTQESETYIVTLKLPTPV